MGIGSDGYGGMHGCFSPLEKGLIRLPGRLPLHCRAVPNGWDSELSVWSRLFENWALGRLQRLLGVLCAGRSYAGMGHGNERT